MRRRQSCKVVLIGRHILLREGISRILHVVVAVGSYIVAHSARWYDGSDIAVRIISRHLWLDLVGAALVMGGVRLTATPQPHAVDDLCA